MAAGEGGLEHSHRDKEQEGRTEENRPSAVCAPSFLSGGRGDR
jgi:hypothetical protein